MPHLTMNTHLQRCHQNGIITRNLTIKYITPEKVWIGLPFYQYLIQYRYLKTENWLTDSKTEAIRLLDVWETDGILKTRI